MLKERRYEIVGIFASIEELDQAVDELFLRGFDQSSLSMLANDDSIKQQLRKKSCKIDMLADGSAVSKAPFYAEENYAIAKGAIIASLMYIGGMSAIYMVFLKGSSLLLALATIFFATILGFLLAKIFSNYHQAYIMRQLAKGGLLLWVSLSDKLAKNIVIRILRNNHARNVHLRHT